MFEPSYESMSLPYRLTMLVDRELVDGEELIWTGQPRPSRFAIRSLPIVLFGIPWTAFSLFWICGAAGFKPPDFTGPMDLFPLFGVPFVLIGIGMLASPLWMVRKARAFADEIPQESVDFLEDRYQVRLLDVRTHPVASKQLTDNDDRAQDGSDLEIEEEVRMDREQILAAIDGQLDDERMAALRAIEDDALFAAECLRAISESHDAAVNQLQADAAQLEERIAELEPDAEDGKAYRQTLVEDAVKARVQAQGDGFDADGYRDVLMGQDLAFVQSERATWQERAAEVLQTGRNFRDPEAVVTRMPAAAYQS